jgi:type I restriction enzyme S subunit
MSRAEFSPALKAEDGDLPEGWQHQQLDQLSELVRDQIQPSAAAGLPYVGLEHVDPGEPTLKRWGAPEDVRSAKTRFAPGDILYGKLRPYLDKSVLAPFAGICSTDILVFRAQADRAIAEFLVSAIHTKPFLEHAVSTTAGVNHPRTSWNALKVHGLAVPPLAEQRAIAGVLRTVQGAKEACERVLAATRQLKQSLLHHLFTYGPVPFTQAARVPLRETAAGEKPEHWQVVPLGDICDVRNGVAFEADDYVGEGVLNFRIVNIKADGRLDIRSDVKFLPASFAEQFAEYLLNSEDILLVMVGATRGKLAFITPEVLPALMNQNMWRVVSGDARVPQRYLYFYLLHAVPIFAKTYSEEARGFFSKAHFRKFPVAFPSAPSELAEIAAQLAAVDAKLAEEESRRAALVAIFQSLLHHLMTGQVRLPEFAGGKA